MSTSILRAVSGSTVRMTLCRNCLLRSMAVAVAVSRQHQHQHRRPIHLSTLEKRRLAQEDWDERAERIQNGKEPHLWDIFKERGYVKDIAGTDDQIRELMRRKRIGAYVGIDPTAASLHLGHLLPLMPLFWMYMHGYGAISVIGGATAKVGDPTDRLKTRPDVPRVERTHFITKIHYQLKRMWMNVDAQARRHGYTKEWVWQRALLNNSNWYSSTPFVEIVHRLFKHMRVGPMLGRETVRRKMADGDGMSLAEFVYPVMQAWDWWELFKGPRGVCMQIGGSDQYGNIVAGIDIIKLLRNTERDEQLMVPDDLLHRPVGFTVPLLTDSAGQKFGKTAGNALWLDPFMTSSFELYGYFMRKSDADVEKLLKLFTFLPLEKIREIMKEHDLDPPKRHAHHILALEVLALVHGVQEAEATQAKHKSMFSKSPGVTTPTTMGELDSYPDRFTPSSADRALHFRPDIQLPESVILGKSIARILYASGLAESASEAHRLISHQGAYVGGAPGRSAHDNLPMRDGEVAFQTVKSWFPSDTKNFLIGGKLLILRRGKHFVRIVEMVSDNEWEASGKTYPGEPHKGRIRIMREQLMAANDGEDAKFSTEELARVNEQLLRMEREGDIALEDADTSKPPQIKFPPTRSRASELLDAYNYNNNNVMGSGNRCTNMADRDTNTALSVQRKTVAIDKVLKRAQSILEEKKRARDEALAAAAEAASKKSESP